MEFLLILGCIVLLIFVLNKIGGLREQFEKLDGTLERLENNLMELSARIKSTSLGPAPAAPNATSRPAEIQPEIIRSPVRPSEPEPPTVAEPVPAPPEPTPSPVSVPIVLPGAADAGLPPEPPVPPSEPPPPSFEPPPPPPPEPGAGLANLEKRFGTQWVVWVGGLALALGGIFLVRYSIEQGLFGPGLRVLFGAILAAALVGLGELARRREIIAGIADLPSAAHIPSILTAAGTTCAYADVWAAYALYNFLSPAAAFVLLGLVALATLAAALRHGPALGGLGLVGAYVTPALVSSHEPSYWALYIYLTVVTAAAYALARVRMWRWLAVTAAALSVLWLFVGLGDPRGGSLSAHAFYSAAGFALAAFFLVAGLFQGPPPAERGEFDPVSCGVLGGYLFGAFMLVMATAHAPLAMVTLLVLTVATVAIAWRSEAAIIAMPMAAVFTALVLVHWALDWWFVTLVAPGGPMTGLPYQLKLADVGLHVSFAAAIAALFGATGFLVQVRTERSSWAVLWATIAVAIPVGLLIVVYYRITQFERSIPFAGLALALAAAFAFATEKLWKHPARPGIAEAGAIFATGAVASLALTLTFALERGWLTIGLSLMVPGIAWIADQRPVPMLRKLCGVIAAVVLARVAYDPRIVGGAVGTTPIFNWLLYGYGLPALAFWAGGHLLRRQGDDKSSRSVESAAIMFTALTAFLEIRHLMNDGDIYRSGVRLGELGLQVSTGLAMVIGLEHMRVRNASVVHDWSARIFAAAAFFAIVFGLLIYDNPIATGQPVGGGVWFNYILLGYGIPAVLVAALARTIRNTRPQFYYIGAAVTAIVLMLVYLTLEVRTLFQGQVLTAHVMSDAEDYTYSAVWLAFGVVLLLAGIVLKSQPARLASAAVVLLTIAKVFLHDLAGVQGIFRALSFIGLGLVLMGIGWLYQRLLFPPQRNTPPAPGSTPTPSEN